MPYPPRRDDFYRQRACCYTIYDGSFKLSWYEPQKKWLTDEQSNEIDWKSCCCGGHRRAYTFRHAIRMAMEINRLGGSAVIERDKPDGDTRKIVKVWDWK